MPTKTAETVHGSVEYEAVECMSCENEIAKESAQKAAIGTWHGKHSWSHETHDELYFSDYATGYVCEYCADEPVGWPTRKFGSVEAAFVAGFLLATLWWVVLFAV